jgi:glycosyltransferase involved in cell wall biosynthesis
MIRVLYDISSLGIGHFRARARTGVFRVAENVAAALVQSPDCSVEFCATYKRSAYDESRRYLREVPAFGEVALHGPASTPLRVRALSVAGLAVDKVPWPAGSRRYAHWAAWKAVDLSDTAGPEPDVHVFGAGTVYHSPYTPLSAAAKVAGVPRFLTVYDMLPIMFPDLFPARIKVQFNQVLDSLTPDDWVIAISHATREDFCRITGFSPDRVFVTHLAADPGMFRPVQDIDELTRVRQKYGIPDSPYILSLNTLEPRKNVQSALAAFGRVVKEGAVPDVQFVLVGTRGWSDSAIWETIDTTPGMRERVHVTGYVEDSDLAAIYSGAALFVYVPLYEGFGLPPLEAMQCGVPVITSNTSSLPEVVGDAALMVSPTDVAGLADAIAGLLSSETRRSELAARSVDRASQFSWYRCAQDTLQAYRVALAWPEAPEGRAWT